MEKEKFDIRPTSSNKAAQGTSSHEEHTISDRISTILPTVVEQPTLPAFDFLSFSSILSNMEKEHLTQEIFGKTNKIV